MQKIIKKIIISFAIDDDRLYRLADSLIASRVSRCSQGSNGGEQNKDDEDEAGARTHVEVSIKAAETPL